MIDEQRVKGFADKVMAAIFEDVQAGAVPWTVTDFGQLHDWVDANMYLEHAGQEFDGTDQGCLDETNAITDLVSQRLAAGEVTGGGEWFTVTWTTTVKHAKVLPLRLLRPDVDGENLRTYTVDADAFAEFEGAATLRDGSERVCIGLEWAEAPPYTEPAGRYNAPSIVDDPRVRLRQAVAELRRLDADAKRLETEGFNDGFEDEHDEAQYRADEQARVALGLALRLLGMPQPPQDKAHIEAMVERKKALTERLMTNIGAASAEDMADAGLTFAEIKAAAMGGHLCDDECGDPTHPQDGRVTDAELDYDEVGAIGLDGTGRDGNPRFPYRWGNLTDTEKTALTAWREGR